MLVNRTFTDVAHRSITVLDQIAEVVTKPISHKKNCFIEIGVKQLQLINLDRTN